MINRKCVFCSCVGYLKIHVEFKVKMRNRVDTTKIVRIVIPESDCRQPVSNIYLCQNNNNNFLIV